MLGNSISLILAKAGAMALGFLFWIVAARTFEPAAVGLAAGAVSSMMLCTQLALVGAGSSVITLLPEHRRAPLRLLDAAFTIVALAALLTGGTFLLLASDVLDELSVVASSPAYAVLFLAMTLLGALGALFDQVSTALRRADQVLVRGVLFGAVTLSLVAVLALVTDSSSSLAIFLPWVAAGAAACFVAAIQLRRSTVRHRYRPRVDPSLAGALLRVGFPNHLLTLTEKAPGLVLPIVVTELLSPEANAVWYAVWMMVWAVYIIPISSGLALFVEAADRPDHLRRAIAHSTRSALAFGTTAALLLALLAPWALSLLGARYADLGVTPLRILLCAFVPLVFVQAYFASCRARRRLAEAIATGALSGTAGVAAAAAAGTVYGLNGMAVAWLGTQLIAGIWALSRLRWVSRRPADLRGVPEPAV
jgi:O-antigen/teichoic acid export membrane protein